LIDEGFLHRFAPQAEIYQHESDISVHGIGSDNHVVKSYVRIWVYMKAVSKEKPIAVKLLLELHIVRDLRANMLIGTDMMARHQIAIDIGRHRAVIGSCNDAKVELRITAKPDRQTSRPVYASQRIVIPAKSEAQLPIKLAVVVYRIGMSSEEGLVRGRFVLDEL
jgi:hypothetical protein